MADNNQAVLTKEQWQDAARFAGVDIGFACYPATDPYTPSYDHPNGRVWRPDTDKADFFDVWVKLEQYMHKPMTADYSVYLSMIYPRIKEYEAALKIGKTHLIMQSGLMLAAAIGKTM